MNDITGGSWEKYYYPNIPEKITHCATFDFMCWEDDNDILAVVDTTLSRVCDEGLVFSTTAMHYKHGNDLPEVFEYDEIESMRVIPHWYGDDLEIDTGYERIIGSTLYKKKLLKALLSEICGIVRDSKNAPDLEADSDSFSGGDIAGTVYGNVSTASTTYGYDKFSTPQ